MEHNVIPRRKHPRWIIDAREPSGLRQWALPPDAHGGHFHMVGLRDWFIREDIWTNRVFAPIPSCGIDTSHMIRASMRANCECTPMSAPCEGRWPPTDEMRAQIQARAANLRDGILDVKAIRKAHGYQGCEHYIPSKCLYAYITGGLPCYKATPEKPQTQEMCNECQHFNPTGYTCARWLQNQRESWHALWGKEKGKTAVVVAPGPHMHEQVEEIKRLYEDRDNYFVMGISRSINAVPLHYYLTIERRMPAYWDPSARKYPNTTLICSTSADERMVRAFRSRYYGETFNGCTEVGHFLDSGMERLSVALGNVSADAIMVAGKLGASKIWLYGYEFACTVSENEDGTTDVGNYYTDMNIRDQHLNFYGVPSAKYMPCHGVDGELCATSYELASVSFYCQAAAELSTEHGIPVWNKTKKGFFWLPDPDEPDPYQEIDRLKCALDEAQDKIRGLEDSMQHAELEKA